MTEHTITARVESMTPLTERVMQVILIPDVYCDYQAGQYLQILHQNEVLSYSIANAPLGNHRYELHIRHTSDHQALLTHLQQTLVIRVPLGECHVHRLNPALPTALIAGGTGFAPMKAMIEQLFVDNHTNPIELFWGARTPSDWYMNDKAHQWQTQHPNFSYFPHQSEPHGVTLAERVAHHHANCLGDWQMVINGPFDMVHHTRDTLIQHGANPRLLFSDAFSNV